MPTLSPRLIFFFFFKQKTAYEITRRDWSSDVCSSDLGLRASASRGLPAAGPAIAALQGSDSCAAFACRQARIASLPRSTLGQSFCKSVAQAVRVFSRPSDLAE